MRSARAICAIVLAAVAASSSGNTVADAEAVTGPRELLETAYDQRYADATRHVLEIAIRNRAGDSTRRRIAVATKHIDGRLHSLGRFLEPEYLRGITVLNIENPDRSDDHFLYLRSLGRIRRVSSAQRADAFMGTDLTYEDFERRRVDDFDLVALPHATLQDEPVHVIEARPRIDSAYDRLELFVAHADLSLLEVRYFKRDSREPYKIIQAPRGAIRDFEGRLLPTHLIVENLARGTRTDVWIEELVVNPELEDHLFTATSVEVGRPIPGLE